MSRFVQPPGSEPDRFVKPMMPNLQLSILDHLVLAYWSALDWCWWGLTSIGSALKKLFSSDDVKLRPLTHEEILLYQQIYGPHLF